jgi:hypothetical protein
MDQVVAVYTFVCAADESCQLCVTRDVVSLGFIYHRHDRSCLQKQRRSPQALLGLSHPVPAISHCPPACLLRVTELGSTLVSYACVCVYARSLARKGSAVVVKFYPTSLQASLRPLP